MRIKPIHISLSPNSQADDIILALRLILTSGAKKTASLEEKFKEYVGAKHAISFNSGRSALFVILRALEIKDGDEVFVQAFTCNAVPNPIFWAGGRPVYVDIDDSLNILPEDLEGKIARSQAQGKHPRAVIVQHTLGMPADMDKIVEITKRHNLVLIEDCAHSLGAKYKGKNVGTFGDVSFFSFGRDKVISSVWGGMITTNNEELARKIREIYHDIPVPSKFWTIKQLFHPILFSIIVPTYYIFGKYLLAALRSGRGITLAVSAQERVGEKPDMFPKKMPDALAALSLHQLGKLEKYNNHRRKIAAMYMKGLRDMPGVILPRDERGAIYLRFNILSQKSNEIIKGAKREHILLGDWYKNIIDPAGTDLEKIGYEKQSCPNAEFAARSSVNLPTHINISVNDAKQVIQYIRDSK